nr:inositol 1,4,5-trisphosphate receptor-interacting protein-like 1 [Columba livia]
MPVTRSGACDITGDESPRGGYQGRQQQRCPSPAWASARCRAGWLPRKPECSWRRLFVYRLLVPLELPPGHSFHLELVTEGEMPLRNSSLRVELECMCIRERKLGDMLCFIHHPEDELMGHQEASLLQTLCTGPYLDMQKTAFWLQELMTAACVAVLQSATCKLTVLPSPRFCKLRMTTAFETSPSIELVLAVQQGNSDGFVTME